MKSPMKLRSAMSGGLVLAVCSALIGPVGPSSADNNAGDDVTGNQPIHLNLGAADLPEQRTASTLAPGVTLTRISRG